MLGNHLGKYLIDLSRHVARVAADVKIRFLLQEVVDEFAILAQQVFNVDFGLGFSGEGIEND